MKKAQLVCGSSMTSGSTELHLGWAILETLFLNLNYTKQWQDLRVMMLGKQRHSAHSLSGVAFPPRTGIYYPLIVASGTSAKIRLDTFPDRTLGDKR